MGYFQIQTVLSLSCVLVSGIRLGFHKDQDKSRVDPQPILAEELNYDVKEFQEAMDDVKQVQFANIGFRPAPDNKAPPVCIDGRLAPSLFLIGAQKSATTSLAARIAASTDITLGLKSFDGQVQKMKELHNFDTAEKFEQMGKEASYLKQFPTCDPKSYSVGFDATPNYMPSIFAPRKIKSMYGNASKQLKFIVLLRDPVKRMQSAYYNAKEQCKTAQDTPWGATNPSVCSKGMTFDKWVGQASLEENQETAGDILSFGHYVPQLKRWFKHFEPSQFIIAPAQYVFDSTGRGQEPLHEYIWKVMHVRPGQKLPKKEDLNSHKHANFAKDMQKENIDKAVSMYTSTGSPAALAGFLHNVIVKANKEKWEIEAKSSGDSSTQDGSSGGAKLNTPTLWGCSRPYTQESIVKWISQNW